MVRKNPQWTVPGMNRIKRKKWQFAVPFLTVLALVLVLSSQSYMEQDIRPWLSSDAMQEKLLRVLEGVNFTWDGQEMSVQSVGVQNLAEFFIRKAAHMMIYSALGFTLNLAFWVLFSWRRSTVAFHASLLCLIIALFDEFNQQFSVARTPRLSDVLIDMYGVMLGMLAFFAIRGLYTWYRMPRITASITEEEFSCKR